MTTCSKGPDNTIGGVPGGVQGRGEGGYGWGGGEGQPPLTHHHPPRLPAHRPRPRHRHGPCRQVQRKPLTICIMILKAFDVLTNMDFVCRCYSASRVIRSSQSYSWVNEVRSQCTQCAYTLGHSVHSVQQRDEQEEEQQKQDLILHQKLFEDMGGGGWDGSVPHPRSVLMLLYLPPFPLFIQYMNGGSGGRCSSASAQTASG